jgi:hypothetical protein
MTRNKNPWEIDPTGWTSADSVEEGYYSATTVWKSPDGEYYLAPSYPSLGGPYEQISRQLGEAWFAHFENAPR